ENGDYALSIEGFYSGLAGLSFSGNDVRFTDTDVHRSREISYEITPGNYTKEYNNFTNTVRYVPVTYEPLGEWSEEITIEHDGTLKPDNYDSNELIELDLAQFLRSTQKNGDGNGNTFDGSAAHEAFSGGS